MELNKIFDKVRLAKKRKELLTFHYLTLKETYFLEEETSFNKSYQSIKGLGRTTRKVLLLVFKMQ